MNERPASANAAPTAIEQAGDEGGDPPCWARLFEDEESDAPPERATGTGAVGPSSAPNGELRSERRP